MLKSIQKHKKIFNNFLSLFSIPNYGILIILLYLTGVSTAFANTYLALFITEEIKMSPIYLGYFTSLTAISSIIISTILGRVSDFYIDRKKILIVTSSAAAIGYGLFSFIREYFLLLLISIVFISVSSASSSQFFAYARQSVIKTNSKESSFAISMLRMFVSIAWVIGPSLGAILLSNLGYRGLYLCAAITYFFVTSITYIFLRGEGKRKESLSKPIKFRCLLNSNILLSLCVFMILQTVNTVSTINLSMFVVYTLNETSSTIGILFSVAAALEIPFMIFFGSLSIKVNKNTLIKIGIISAFVYFLGLLIVVNYWEIFVVLPFSACFVAAFMGLGITYFQELIPNEVGTATTLYSNTTRLGSIFGGIITGEIGGVWGIRAVFFACIILVIIAFYMFLCCSKNK